MKMKSIALLVFLMPLLLGSQNTNDALQRMLSSSKNLARQSI
jgi:hypothetical protein